MRLQQLRENKQEQFDRIKDQIDLELYLLRHKSSQRKLIKKLEEARQTAYDQLDQIENRDMTQTSVREESSNRTPMDVVNDLEKALDGFSHTDLPFLEDIQRRAKAAMEKMDKPALDAIIKEMKEYKRRKEGGSDDNADFNLNDFKGGF